jgi:hypothetical protein
MRLEKSKITTITLVKKGKRRRRRLTYNTKTVSVAPLRPWHHYDDEVAFNRVEDGLLDMIDYYNTSTVQTC